MTGYLVGIEHNYFLSKNLKSTYTALQLLQLNIHFTTVFELRAAAEEALVFRPDQGELGKSRLAQIARYVAATGQVGQNTDTVHVYI
jgi:hypothetical protein